MTKNKDNRVLSVVRPNCCGLDVHKKVIAACMVLLDEFGNETTISISTE